MHPTSDTCRGSNPTPRIAAPEGKILLTVEEATTRMSVGRTKLFALIKDGQIRSVKIGKSRRIVAASIHEFVEARLADAS